MQTLDMTFFEEYKRLDQLCGDMYACRNGISKYLERMENARQRGIYKVPNWDNDYRELKHLRWVRNQIAHDLSGAACGQDDLIQVQDFYSRILCGNDPLTLLRKANEAEIARRNALKKQQKQLSQTNPQNRHQEQRMQAIKNLAPQYQQPKRKLKTGIVAVVSIAAMMLLALLFIFFR